MGLFQLFGKETVVGIDIGSSCIKAVEIEPYGSGWRLANAGIQATPPESCRDGVITNTLDVAQAVKTLLRCANMRAQGAIAAISGSQVIVRQVKFPKMTEASLRKSIRFEASKYVSASMEDSVVEFQILDNAQADDQMNVMLVAAPRDMIESRVAVLEMAGLEPISIDVEAFALIRSLAERSLDSEFLKGSVALIDMGASHTDVNIVCDGDFALTRNVPIAGDSLTSAIKSLTAFSFEDSERLKFEMTLQDSVDQLSSQETENKCWRVVQPLLDELLREIRRSMHYYQSQFPEGAEQAVIKRIILSGGGSRMPGMPAYVSSKLNIPVEIADVFGNSLISPGRFTPDFIDEYGPALAIAAGLALKEDAARAALPMAA
ncbi:MAG: type IV pilus assembly protein PilM [Armatimonadota bacterium]|nr:type IV pilus assembly protein PilM [Armatimonadota bacterium]